MAGHPQAIGLEVKAAERAKTELGKVPSDGAKVGMNMYYKDKTLMLI